MEPRTEAVAAVALNMLAFLLDKLIEKNVLTRMDVAIIARRTIDGQSDKQLAEAVVNNLLPGLI